MAPSGTWPDRPPQRATPVLPPLAALLVALSVVLCAPAMIAADKSGVSPNAISLPKGPGSIEGLGESFQPSLNTGTAKYGVPLKLPPGTAGHAPHLRLGYEGGGGNGVLGFGWQFTVGAVQRRTDRGIPTYGEPAGFSREDVFLEGSREELVPQADGFWFAKNESAFVRYRQLSNHWEATTPQGTRLDYGVTPEARIADGATGHTFSWLLQRETDAHGNTVLYSYTTFPGLQNTNQKYLASISYGPGAPHWENFHFVTLVYEDRPDWFEDCRAGFVVRTGKRLKRILVGTQGPVLAGHQQGDFSGDGITDNLDRIYELEYMKYAGTNSHWSLLGSVRLIGADGTNSLPPATFGYVVCNPPDLLSAADKAIGSVNEPPLVMDSELAELADLNGDGLPDILRTGGLSHQVWLNLGEGVEQGERVIRWAPPQEVESATGDAWSFRLDETTTHLADMDGDGLADLVHKAADGSVFYFASQGKSAWGERNPMSAGDFLPPAPFGVAGVRTADVDFDKRMDLIRGDGLEYQIWFNFGQNQYSERITVPQEAGFDFSLPGVQIADVNGDRVPDVTRIRPMTVEVTAGLGYGRFAALVSIPVPDGPLEDGQIAKAKLADLNGDGLADLVIERAAPAELWYWLNLGNYTLSGRKTITGLPTGIGQNAVIRWADLNGNGTVDLVYADQTSVPRLRTVDIGELMGCTPAPNTLVVISNGIGQATFVGYQPSTKLAQEDAAAGAPWRDLMPFPVSVVVGVTNLDSLGHSYVTLYRYHDGYYDPTEKQFRGFARAEQIEVGDPSVPTLVTRSHFDTGREFQPMKGKLTRLTAEQEDGNAFWDETTAWTTPPRVLRVGTNGTNVVYVHPVARTTVITELGRGTPKRLESEFAYDSYGNQTTNANYGVVQDGDRSAFDDERITTVTFAINTNAWLLRNPARLQILDENGAVIARTDSFYDDETFSAGNFGSVTRGNLTLKHEWIEPASANRFIRSSRTQYDAYGNPVVLLDPLAGAPGGQVDFSQGHVRELRYDALFHTYLAREAVHVGSTNAPISIQVEQDAGFGVITASLDFNANRTTYGWDQFGRLVEVVHPGDSAGYPTVEHRYFLAVPAGSSGLVNYVETRQLDKEPGSAGAKRDHYFISRQYTDGLGRTLLRKQEAEPAAGETTPRVLVTEAALFSARQNPARLFHPFFTALDGDLDQRLEFEFVDQPSWTGLFQEAGALMSLAGTNAHSMTRTFDATLRELTLTNPDGTWRRTQHEPLATMFYDENDTDPASPHFDTPTIHHTDGLGRLTRVDEVTRLDDAGAPAGSLRTWTTRFVHDLNDQVIQVIDSQNNTKRLAYDGLKRLTAFDDPDRGTMTYLYDDASNLTETTDAKGQRITYAYDGASRILTEDYHDENSTGFSYHRSPDVTYHYDTAAGRLDQGDLTTVTARNVNGTLSYVEDCSGEEHLSYDARGRQVWRIKRISEGAPGQTFLANYRTAFEHDSSDRLTRLVYPDNDEVRYRYNERSLVRQIDGGPGGCIISNTAYWPSAQRRQTDYGNGVRTAYSHDSRLRLKQILTHPLSRPLEPFIHFRYDFDAASNLKTIGDLRPGSTLAAGDPRRNTQVLQYDDQYRLTQAQYSFNLPGGDIRNDGVISYRYDRIGNMLAQTSTIDHQERGLPVCNLGDMDSGGNLGRWNRSGRAPNDPPGPHALTSIRNPSLANRQGSYDPNGNLSEIDGLTNTWDFKDRLVAVENDQMRAQYTYDYNDLRVLKQVWSKPGSPSSGALAPQPSRVLYVNQYFEVRESDQPVKYVWDQETRVARLSGSLSANPGLQRLRLQSGWNLVGLAVSPTDILSQFSAQTPPVGIDVAFRWSPATQGWIPLSQGEALPAGSVLWLRAASNGVVSIIGPRSEVAGRSVSAGGDFVASASLRTWDLPGSWMSQPAAELWRFDGSGKQWLGSSPFLPPLPSTVSSNLGPGEVVFIRSSAPAELAAPDPALRLCYYHQDHLGSTAAMTDAAGAVAMETAYYPFGHPRRQFQPRGFQDHYQYAQNERDEESGLSHFGARFLSTSLGRFASADPVFVANPASGDASSGSRWKRVLPANLNLYAYSRNSPLVLTDPLGLAPTPTKSFLTAEEAMLSAGQAMNPDSISENVEMAHQVCVDVASDRFVLSARITGTERGVTPEFGVCPDGTVLANELHSHGDFAKKRDGQIVRAIWKRSDQYDSDNFSRTDKSAMQEKTKTIPRYSGALATPGGQIKKYDPATGKETDLNSLRAQREARAARMVLMPYESRDVFSDQSMRLSGGTWLTRPAGERSWR
jgi:RHS repeat-associated protein